MMRYTCQACQDGMHDLCAGRQAPPPGMFGGSECDCDGNCASRTKSDDVIDDLADGFALWEEHRPQSAEDWIAVAERFIDAGETPDLATPLFAALVQAVKQTREKLDSLAMECEARATLIENRSTKEGRKASDGDVAKELRAIAVRIRGEIDA